MTEFGRRGHYRTNAYGTTFWVSGHVVNRDDWDRSQYGGNLERADALSFLHRLAARTISGCYVNPNARCPVCREPVFFYANEFGSRVFFDELGPAWTKHPCTDNPKRPVDTAHIVYRPPRKRKTGERLELLQKAEIAGFSDTAIYGNDRDQWHLLVINSVIRERETYTVICECITIHPPQEVRFKIISQEAFFDVGDFVSKRGRQFSFFHRDSMSVINFRGGELLQIPREKLRIPSEKNSVHALPKEARAIEPQKPVKSKNYLSLLTHAERVQLVGDGLKTDKMCERLKPVVEGLWNDGVRTLESITGKLNSLGYGTATGADWTPRLCAVLLGFIKGNVPRLPRLSRASAPPQKTATVIREANLSKAKVPVKKLTKMISPRARQALTREEWARRLEVLGRVKLTGE